MKYIILVLATLSTTTFWAQEEIKDIDDQIFVEYIPTYQTLDFLRTDSVYNPQLNQNEAIYHFDLLNLRTGDSSAIVHYSVDSTDFYHPLKDGRLTVKTTPGPHAFQIYVNSSYLEAMSPALISTPQTELTYSVILSSRPFNEPVMTYKPVIYLYPEETTEVEVGLHIHKGKHPFFYPTYNDKWSLTAASNGDLTIDGEQFRYLFWEAQQDDHLNEIEVDAGFMVDGSDAVSFLEDKLSMFGLTAEERADFITFWGPIIAKNDHNLIRFEWNETCDKFADLNISPQPDHVYRVYIFVAPLDHPIEIAPQKVPSMERDGFTVLEWGGQVSNYEPNTAL